MASVQSFKRSVRAKRLMCMSARISRVVRGHRISGARGRQDCRCRTRRGGERLRAAVSRRCYARGQDQNRAQKTYGAADISLEARAAAELADFTARGFGHLPVCIAKTQYSFSTDANLRGAPTGHVINVREARLSAGRDSSSPSAAISAPCRDCRESPPPSGSG